MQNFTPVLKEMHDKNNNLKNRIAFVTCRDLGRLTPDDQLAADILLKNNVMVNAVAWDDPDVKWQELDAVILRSTWNYHRQLQHFLQWLEMLDQLKIRVWNPTVVIRANVSKKYMIDLQNAGIPIVPTVFLPLNKTAHLRLILEKENWERVIIKPEVSASAYQTITASLTNAEDDQKQLDEILKTSGALIQEFRNEIIETGEWSFIFFGRKFSHAVLKHPRAGDFRVQEELGGIIQATSPSDSLIQQAQRILDQVQGMLLYARVDGIVAKDELLVMELELIEPSLFMGFSTGAAERFANSIIKLL
jgi:hypothetical protein